MITLVSALMCARRQLPPSDAGGLQLSNLVASMGRHLIPARRSSQETGPPKPPPPAPAIVPTPADKREAWVSVQGEVLGEAPKSLWISSQQCRFVTKHKRLQF